MPQDFYTLEEAARRLGVSPEQLLDMARPGASGQPSEVRSFMDRGAPRFRKTEIEEVARRRGLGSDADVPLGLEERGGGHSPTEPVATEVFPFELAPEEKEPEEETDIFAGLGGSVSSPTADSEVRLIAEGSDLALQPAPADSVHQGSSDSGARIDRPGSAESSVQLGREFERGQSDSDINLGAPLGGGPKSGKLPPDSGVRLVEDWLVAKEQVAQSGLSGLGLGKTGPKSGPQGPKSTPPGPKSTPPSAPKSGKVTPFSLAPDSSKSTPKPPPSAKPSEEGSGSSEFELTPLADFEPSDSVFDPSSVEHAAVPGRDTGKIPPRTEKKVTDSDDESISFEISPEPESTSDTMRRKKAKEAEKAKPAAAKKEDSSEFDLTPLKEAEDSSSEFELTLEDEEGHKPKAPEKTKAGAKKSSDIDLAPLEEEDTSVEGSDFELALEEEPEAGEGDTGSEVVVIDEESGEEAAGQVELEEEGEELVVEAAGDEEETPVAAVTAAPAEWGWWGLMNLPTTLLLLFTGFLLLEMMRSIWSYSSPSNSVSGAVFEMISKMFK